jgi:hypothetical protein
LSQQEAAKQKAEKEAIEKITQATLLGIKKGEEASKKLHADAKVQTEEQTTKAIEKLKNKFDSTKAQVIAIVQNFGKIHSDLQELKQEYLQEQSNLQGYLQLSNMTIGSELSEHDAKVHELQSQVALKKQQVKEVVDNFLQIHTQLLQLKSSFDEARHGSEIKLSQLKSEQEDSQLVAMFERDSAKF